MSEQASTQSSARALDAPAHTQAARVLAQRGRELVDAARAAAKSEKKAAKKPDAGVEPEKVHKLRVAVRRGETALEAFAPFLPAKASKDLRERLRTLRQVAGSVRDTDVQAQLLNAAGRRRGTPTAARQLARALAERLADPEAGPRCDAAKRLRKRLKREFDSGSFEGAWAKMCEEVDDAQTVTLLRDHAAVVLAELLDRVASAASKNIARLALLHKLRLELKSLRYGLELFSPWFSERFHEQSRAGFSRLQDALGEVNDADVLVRYIESRAKESPAKNLRGQDGAKQRASFKALIASEHARRDAAHEAFLKRWERFDPAAFVEALRAELTGYTPELADAASQAGTSQAGTSQGVASQAPRGTIVEPKPPAKPTKPTKPLTASAGQLTSHTGSVGGPPHTEPHAPSKRIAAIDVGTNSIRLIVAETSPHGGYRVLDDEKEITRLGRGLHATGKLDASAIEHSAATIAHMRAIAEGYGASQIRVVATSASRDAKNAGEFVKAVKSRAGLEMDVISGEEEAMLAFRSASRAFDVSSQPTLVFDIGGGSTELVLSAPAGDASANQSGARNGTKNGTADRKAHSSGVIERIYSLPLGAVRLTEMFGGPDDAPGRRYSKLRQHVADMLKKRVGKPPIVPALIIGTGGTVTTLAGMQRHRDIGGSTEHGGTHGLFLGSVQGVDIARADLKHILEQLRGMSLKERSKLPGLPADRADIIIAGLVIVDEVLERFGGNRVRAHEGGIRDGLLLTMAGDHSTAGPEFSDPMRGVRRFARACGYEATHSEHVTSLALSMFDHLAAAQLRACGTERTSGLTLEPRHRVLLEAACVLHDVGYLISYAQHHKHSYHLIVHADLPGLTRREVQVVANVARYHRSAEPKLKHRPFAELSESERTLVEALAGILRIADGLDRTHSQTVTAVRLGWVKRGSKKAEGKQPDSKWQDDKKSGGKKQNKGSPNHPAQIDAEKLAHGIEGIEGIEITAVASTQPDVNLWGAERKSGLFARVFGCEVRLAWEGQVVQEARSGRGVSREARSEKSKKNARNPLDVPTGKHTSAAR